MPTKVENFSLWRAIEGMSRALKTISREDGFNTTPRVQTGGVLLDKIGAGDFPALAFEMGDLEPVSDGDLQGGSGLASTGHLRFAWPCFVWGYVTTSEDKAALYRTGTALLADVFSAVYDDETLPDGAGSGSILFANAGEVVFDMESFAQDKRGYFVAEFRLIVSIERGANP